VAEGSVLEVRIAAKTRIASVRHGNAVSGQGQQACVVPTELHSYLAEGLQLKSILGHRTTDPKKVFSIDYHFSSLLSPPYRLQIYSVHRYRLGRRWRRYCLFGRGRRLRADLGLGAERRFLFGPANRLAAMRNFANRRPITKRFVLPGPLGFVMRSRIERLGGYVKLFDGGQNKPPVAERL